MFKIGSPHTHETMDIEPMHTEAEAQNALRQVALGFISSRKFSSLGDFAWTIQYTGDTLTITNDETGKVHLELTIREVSS